MNQTNICTCNTSNPLLDITTQVIISLVGAGVGAVIGAYFGLILARKWDRKKHSEERNEERKITISSLLEELEVIKKEIVDVEIPHVTWNSGFNNFIGLRIHTITPAFDSTINSGNFSLLSQSLQTALGKTYLRIRNCQYYNDEMWKFRASQVFNTDESFIRSSEAEKLASRFNDQMDQLKNEIIAILPKLKTELKTSSNPET